MLHLFVTSVPRINMKCVARFPGFISKHALSCLYYDNHRCLCGMSDKERLLFSLIYAYLQCDAQHCCFPIVGHSTSTVICLLSCHRVYFRVLPLSDNKEPMAMKTQQ
ncbi:hypothetical protein LSH36_389g00008 [Paralvinella palmiformis]|uniref:Uncharacterized protein n=1 Tax=Paralvinella palmiformis TaxID=53620 RepID=A0AAD9JDH8_9ANNE|nr:hypothetical protein LSH36_389g00008 [Paralvinella palmiformis]